MRRLGVALLVVGVLVVIVMQKLRDETPLIVPPRSGYLVLALSWTPSWCAFEGSARGANRCAPGAGSGWLVHGLWPQLEDGGWPEFCDTPHATPTRAQTAAMRDIMGSDGLALHQWRKHGTCTGRSAQSYFDQMRTAFENVTLPREIRTGGPDARMTPTEMLTLFRAANPAIEEDMVMLTCRDSRVQELRLCLTHDLAPRPCDAALRARGCRARHVNLPAPP